MFPKIDEKFPVESALCRLFELTWGLAYCGMSRNYVGQMYAGWCQGGHIMTYVSRRFSAGVILIGNAVQVNCQILRGVRLEIVGK